MPHTRLGLIAWCRSKSYRHQNTLRQKAVIQKKAVTLPSLRRRSKLIYMQAFMLEHVKAQQLFADRYIFSQLHFNQNRSLRLAAS